MDYTVHGILQARILEWEALDFDRCPAVCLKQESQSVSCVSAFPGSEMEEQESLPLATRTATDPDWGCVGSEWHTCVVPSSADGRGSGGHSGRRVHDPLPPARLKARSSWCKIGQDLPSQSPCSVRSIHLQMVPLEAERSVASGGRRAEPPGSTPISTLWFLCLCCTSYWSDLFPPLNESSPGIFWIIEFLSPALLLGNF